MVKNNRLRSVGLLGAVTALLALGTVVPASAYQPGDLNLSPCAGVPGNLVKNCSFEAPTGSGVPGWEHLVNQNSFVSTDTANSGTHSLRLGSGSYDDVWTQTVAVSPHTKYLVGAFVETLGGTPNNTLQITTTNVGSSGAATTIYSTQNQEIANWTQVGAVVTTGSGRTMTLTITGRNPPAQNYVDDLVVVAQPSGCAAIVNNAVKNCGFEAATVAPWVHSVDNVSGVTNSTSNGGNNSLFFNSTGADDVWNQVVTVRPHTTYTLRYSAWYTSHSQVPNNDLTVSVSNAAVSGGKVVITRTNVPNQFWKQVTRTFTTGSGSSAVVTISGRNAPVSTRVDDFSLTVAPRVKVAVAGKKVVTTLTGLGGQKVQLQKLVGSHWAVVHTFLAPKSGVTKAWALTVSKGKYRAVARSTPGYVQVVSGTVKR